MTVSDHMALAKKFELLPSVYKFAARNGEPEASVLGYTIAEIAESAEKITNHLMPKLRRSKDDAVLEELLDDFGDELRHILYHIRDSRYFEYLGAGDSA